MRLSKVELEVLFCLGDLLRGKVSRLKLVVEGLEVAAVDHFERVDHVAQTLAHLAAFLVPHHRVQIYFGEGQLVR